MAKHSVATLRKGDVLLTLKSELWQSRPGLEVVLDVVLLTLKSELWQSCEQDGIDFTRKFCSH